VLRNQADGLLEVGLTWSGALEDEIVTVDDSKVIQLGQRKWRCRQGFAGRLKRGSKPAQMMSPLKRD
jgi:hypothetical protein